MNECISTVYRCSVVINFFENASKINIRDDLCNDCGANIVEVGYKVDAKWVYYNGIK